jgi:5-methylcytosine-specific restriction endonuclease McrA
MKPQLISKNCLICGAIFCKRQNKSWKEWNEIAKYCSRSCSAISLRDVTIARNKAGIGKKASDKTKQKMSLIRRGKPSHMLGKKHSEETKRKIKNSTIASQTPEVRLKKSLAHRGEKSHNWKGGRTSLKHLMRTTGSYIGWRTKVFIRDNYTCVWCGDERGGNLEADHIIEVKTIYDKYKLTNIHEILACEALWDVDNGRTLCKTCHIKRHKDMI